MKKVFLLMKGREFFGMCCRYVKEGGVGVRRKKNIG